MIISPTVALERAWITPPEGCTPEQLLKSVQPNAIDWTANELAEIDSLSIGMLSETQKQGKSTVKVIATAEWGNVGGFWRLERDKVYTVESSYRVALPEGVAALLVIRSTLARSGVRMNSGVFDSGYIGNIGATLSAHAGDYLLAPGTRVGQIVFLESGKAGLYAGGYNN